LSEAYPKPAQDVECRRDGHGQNLHSICLHDVQGSDQRSRHTGNENQVPAVGERFHEEAHLPGCLEPGQHRFHRILAFDANHVGANMFHQGIARHEESEFVRARAQAANQGSFRDQPNNKAATHYTAEGHHNGKGHTADRLVRQPFKHGRYDLENDRDDPGEDTSQDCQRNQDYQSANDGRFQESIDAAHWIAPLRSLDMK
jgi:hypothetical protein